MSEEIVPGYIEAKQSLMAKLEDPINMYLLAKLHIGLFMGRDDGHYIQREIKENMIIHAREIGEILLKDIENQ